MKLSEALIVRADIQKHISDLLVRICSNARTQEGEPLAEYPDRLIKEMNEATEQLCSLVQRINKTNCMTEFENGTLSDGIAKRDILMKQIAAYQKIYTASTEKENRYSRSELRFVCNVDITEFRKTLDRLAAECRELDIRIQAANWATELL